MITYSQIKLKVSESFIHIKLHRRKTFKILIEFMIICLIPYFLFFCPLTRLTQEGLITFLSQRTPPSWLVPSQPGEFVDFDLTKSYKRLKLAEFKKKVYMIKLDFKSALKKGKDLDNSDSSNEKNNLNPVKTTNQSFWHIVSNDLSDAVSTLAEFWTITIVTDQERQEKMIVGEGSKPINLNNRVLRWQKEIEAAAEKYHLEPALLAAMIEQESGGEPEALSPVGAIGLMQLMPSTAVLMGVNPYDPAENIDGGAHYLELQLESFGNLQAALAAYNAGPGEVQNGHWVKIPETLNYVQEIPALFRKYEQIWQEKGTKSKEEMAK